MEQAHKKQLEKLQTELVRAKQAIETTEEAKRNMITDTFEKEGEYLKQLAEDAPHAHREAITDILSARGNIGCASGKDLDDMMKVASVVHCASIDRKKRNADTDLMRETKDELRNAYLKLEASEENSAKDRRTISELQAYAEEKQAELETVSMRLEAITGAVQPHAFPNNPRSRTVGLERHRPTQRERIMMDLQGAHMAAQSGSNKEPLATKTEVQAISKDVDVKGKSENYGIPSNMSTGGAPLTASMPSSELTSVVHAASMPKTQPAVAADMPTPSGFAGWAMSHGLGSSRIMRAQTSHHILGGEAEPSTSTNGISTNVEAAIRAHLPY